MIDIKVVREKTDFIQQSCVKRGYTIDIANIVSLDGEWRTLKQEDDNLRSERNKLSIEINEAKKEKKDIKHLLKRAQEIPTKLTENEAAEKALREKIDSLLSMIPNVQKDDVPVGGEDKNEVIKTWGKIPASSNLKGHLELGEALGMIDMKRATKISGAGFYLLSGQLAKLQRSLIQYMLDFHVKNGFTEINPPQMVNRKTAFGTGNLPKFDDQLYKTNDDLILVPTAEVPVTNIYANENLTEKDLPKKFCAFTECYRTEAGRRAGEEGLFRLHQFEKVEMVYICPPEQSDEMHEEMTSYAEKILESLELPYRRIVLATADAGFSSAKTYDIETWSPGMNKYLETSSCSTCTDFQARRMNTKYQAKDGVLKFVHTLNGSGLALPRLMIAVMENYQRPDGTIDVPKVLWPYTGFKRIGSSEKETKEEAKPKSLAKKK